MFLNTSADCQPVSICKDRLFYDTNQKLRDMLCNILKQFLYFRFQIRISIQPYAQFVAAVHQKAAGQLGQTVKADI